MMFHDPGARALLYLAQPAAPNRNAARSAWWEAFSAWARGRHARQRRLDARAAPGAAVCHQDARPASHGQQHSACFVLK